MLLRHRRTPPSLLPHLCLLLVLPIAGGGGCSNDRRTVDNGGAGGEGEGEGEEDAGPDDSGNPQVREGGIILPDCEDVDRDGYGVGDGCLALDIDDTDHLVYPGAPEICDGKDNDGNDQIDGDDPRFAPDPCALTEGVCRGKNSPCVGGVSQPCDAAMYGADYREREETADFVCDHQDNDCDGEVDDGCDCADGDVDECPDVPCAVRRCTENGTWGPCLQEREAEPEVCDGVDNDCDGDTDEAEGFGPSLCGRCAYDMLLVDTNNLDLCIDRWEASREDATANNPGENTAGKPLSRGGVLPWTNVTRNDALSACRRVGKDLCTVAQWRTACIYIGKLNEDPDWVYVYGERYDAGRCNDAEAGNGRPVPTGSMPDCRAEVACEALGRQDADCAAMDLSGNVREWAKEEVEGGWAALGGSHDAQPAGLRCDATEVLTGRHADLETGFRCCTSLQAN